MLTFLRRPASVLTLANLSGMMLGVVSAAIQARVLGPIGRGDLATAIVPGTVFSMLVCLGLPDYFSRKAAQDGDGRSASKQAMVLSLIIGCVIIWPYMMAIGFLAPQGSDPWSLLQVYGFLTPIFVYGHCLVAIAMGISRWPLVAASRLLPQVFTVVGLIFLSFGQPSAKDVGILLILSAVCGLLIPLGSKMIRPSGRLRARQYSAALSFGLRGWTAGSLALLNQRVDLLLLTVIAAKEDLGYYAIATTVASLVGTLSVAVGLPARNKVAQGDTGHAVSTTALVLTLTAAASVALAVALPWLLPIVLGAEFVPAISITWILIAAQVPLGGIVVLTFSLVASGRPSAPLMGEAIALATTTSAILIAYPTFGILTAAWANFAGNLLSLCALLILSRRHLSNAPLWRYFLLTPSVLRGVLATSKSARTPDKQRSVEE